VPVVTTGSIIATDSLTVLFQLRFISYNFSFSYDLSITVTVIDFQFLFPTQLVILHKICIRESKTQNR